MPTTTSTALRVTLVVSLALNIFAAGAYATNLWRHDGHGQHRGQALGMDPRALRETLPGEDRELLRNSMREHRPQMRERVRSVKEARHEVAAALRAEPFDKVKLAEAFALLRERQSAIAEAAQGTMIDVAEKATPEGREAMAQQMLRGRPPPGPGGRFGDRAERRQRPERGPPPDGEMNE